METCSHCGREARPGDRYCQYCGQQLDVNLAHLAGSQSAPVYQVASSSVPDWTGPHAGDAPLEDAVPEVASAAYVASAPVVTATMVARLIVRAVPPPSEALGGADQEFALDGGDVAIGRAPSCDVVLEDDQLASRRHALMRYLDGHYTIIDLGSSNGTFVNELEIHEATVLHDGDQITIGGHSIEYSTSEASPHASLAGSRLSAPLLRMPLGETNPHVSVVNLVEPGAAVASGPLDAPEALAEDSAAAGTESTASAESEEPVALAAESAESEEPAAIAPEDAPLAAAASTDDGAPALAMESVASVEMPAVVVSAPVDDLETLRAQLAEVSAALARRADDAARTAERLRAALVEIRDRVVSILTQPVAAAETGGGADDLITVARQAADHPRDLDHLTALAAHAGAIASALERAAASRSPDDEAEALRSALDGLRARLDELLD